MLAIRPRFTLSRLGICTRHTLRHHSRFSKLAKRKRKAEWKRRQSGNFLDHVIIQARGGTPNPGNFLDHVIIQARGGKGGDGCVAFHREKFKPFGPPSVEWRARRRRVHSSHTKPYFPCERDEEGTSGRGIPRARRVETRAQGGRFNHSCSARHGRSRTHGQPKAKDPWESEEESLQGLDEEEAELKRLDRRWVPLPMHEESNIDREDFKAAQKAIEREERAQRREYLANVREPMHLDLTHPMASSLAASQPCYDRHIDPEKGYLVASGGAGVRQPILSLLDQPVSKVCYAWKRRRTSGARTRGSRSTEPVLDTSESSHHLSSSSSTHKIKSLNGLHTEQTRFTIADNPGLIERASENVGLGHSFLKSIERSLVLVYVLDFSAPEPWTDLRVLHDELEMYQPGLPSRARLVIANKADLLPSATDAEVHAAWNKLRRLQDEVDALAWDDGGQTGPIEVLAISGKFKQNLSRVVQRWWIMFGLLVYVWRMNKSEKWTRLIGSVYACNCIYYLCYDRLGHACSLPRENAFHGILTALTASSR
ncbi:GTPase [Rhizoctonia solani]|uniref:GTPase n=1 Tax=Rhizoctonia solani TaxID=456999 RepID=A0A8H8T273_9AGAM|nr:GTPase [Rhizoctonia solani]QRW26049.1 GTPase [Rhizoctonia solani]